MSFRAISFIVAILSVVAGSSAMANGYFIGHQGARSAGRAGASVVRADDLSAMELNPAGLARLDGTMIYLGNRLSYSDEYFRRAPTLDWSEQDNGVAPYVEFEGVSNENSWQLLDPILGAASDFGLDDWGFALGVYAPAGIANQRFPEDGGQRYMLLTRDVQILYFTASAAWKYNDLFGVGLSVQWVDIPRLEFELIIDANTFVGKVNPVSSELDMRAKITGADHFGFTSVVGAWFRPSPCFELALSGQVIPVRIESESTLEVTPVSPEITEEVVLKRDGELADDVTMSMPLPVTARLGGRYIYHREGVEAFDIELDIVYQSWSIVERYEMDGNGLIGELLGQRLDVDRLVLEKQWRDTISVQLGGDVVLMPEHLTIRAGAFYESPAAKPGYAYVDFYTGHQFGGSAGLSVRLYGLELAVSYTYVYQLPMTVTQRESRVYQQVPGSQCKAPYTDTMTCNEHYLGKPSAPINAGTYRAQYHLGAAALLYRF
jgi:long-chain fatty acid transport protein